jgi:tetrahydromethanopterin S-methyltransferase subunit B
MLTALFAVPSSSDIFSAVGDYSSGVFTNLWPLFGVAVGLLIGALFFMWITRKFSSAIKTVAGGRRRGGRRRR